MDPLIFSVVTGLGLGFASTLHCAGMCGAISASLLLASGPAPAARTGRTLALTHTGRIGAYVLAGTIVGALGAPAVGWLDRDTAFRLLQWAGAAALMWVGLSIAGLLPTPSGLDRLLRPLSAAVARMTATGPAGNTWTPLGAGFAWGLMPCAMVYGALFMSLIAGTPTRGALVMMAFGIGTLPGLFAAALGVKALASAARAPSLRIAAGLAIGTLGFLTVWIPHPTSSFYCVPGETAALGIVLPIP